MVCLVNVSQLTLAVCDRPVACCPVNMKPRSASISYTRVCFLQLIVQKKRGNLQQEPACERSLLLQSDHPKSKAVAANEESACQ